MKIEESKQNVRLKRKEVKKNKEDRMKLGSIFIRQSASLLCNFACDAPFIVQEFLSSKSEKLSALV